MNQIQKVFVDINSYYQHRFEDTDIYYKQLVNTFSNLFDAQDELVDDFISNSLHYCLHLSPLSTEYAELKNFDPILILAVVVIVVDNFNYDINKKKNDLLELAVKVLNDQNGTVYHLNCFYSILHLFNKIDDERFLDILDRYIGILNEENFFGGIGEELFLYFNSHRSNKAELIIQKHSKDKFEQLGLYLS